MLAWVMHIYDSRKDGTEEKDNGKWLLHSANDYSAQCAPDTFIAQGCTLLNAFQETLFKGLKPSHNWKSMALHIGTKGGIKWELDSKRYVLASPGSWMSLNSWWSRCNSSSSSSDQLAPPFFDLERKPKTNNSKEWKRSFINHTVERKNVNLFFFNVNIILAGRRNYSVLLES